MYDVLFRIANELEHQYILNARTTPSRQASVKGRHPRRLLSSRDTIRDIPSGDPPASGKEIKSAQRGEPRYDAAYEVPE